MTTTTDDVVEAEIVDEPTTALAHRDPKASLTLFGTDDPTEALEKAGRAAKALRGMIEDAGLAKKIGGRSKPYVQVEGWQALGGILGLSCEIVWTREILDPKSGEVLGWEARAEVRRPDGTLLSAGEAECRRAESRWETAESYAIRSMAQTRATSKSYRGALAFVMVLAGYAPTPAEEMDGVKDHTPKNLSEHPCPHCGDPLIDQRAEHRKSSKMPAWKCSNAGCGGGSEKKDGDGRWPWASWKEEPPPPPEEPFQKLIRLIAVNYTCGNRDHALLVIDEAARTLGIVLDDPSLGAEDLNAIWKISQDVALGLEDGGQVTGFYFGPWDREPDDDGGGYY